MKFSYRWLSELVPRLEADAAAVGREITMKTAECDGVDRHGDDFVIEIDNKSLTHRPDLWGHFGMAREVAAHFERTVKDAVDLGVLPQGPSPVTVKIENFDLCPRFSAVMFENVTVAPSPKWLQDRLEAIGLNPINNLVDITNCVMAELPQPMHAFDADKVRDHTLIARPAHAGERLTALNEQTYDLDPSMIVVAGLDGPLGIAGVIGGQASMIGPETRRVIFESANWHPVSVRKTSATLRLRTDASMRYEKALDPENCGRGIARAIQLMAVCCPEAKVVGGWADVYRPLIPPDPIDLPLAWLERKLGKAISAADAARILSSLGFGIAGGEDSLTVTVPSWRATKDISVKEDLVEEVGRIIGYASIVPTAPLMAVTPPPANRPRSFHARLRNALRYQGFNEVQNYSFVSESDLVRFGYDPANTVRVKNPIAENQAFLRPSLIVGICHNVEENRKHFESFRLFEIGNAILGTAEESQIPHLTSAIYAKDDGIAGLNELKRVASGLMPGAIFRMNGTTHPYQHPARSARVEWRGRDLGQLFEFHPDFVEAGRAAVLDLDLRLLRELGSGIATQYSPIGRFPSSSFDLAVVVDGRTLAGDVARDLPDAEFVEDYRLPDGRRSLLFRVTLSSPDRTLTGDEVTAARAALIDKLRTAGYDLRV